MKKILIYVGNLKIEENSMIKAIEKVNASYSYIDDTNMTDQMKDLLETDNKKIKNGKRKPFLYIESEDVEEIQALEDALNEENIIIKRKAVRTKTNETWNLETLMDEVENEYQYFKLKDRLYYLVRHPDKEKIEKDQDYLKLMSMAFSLVEDDKVTSDILEIAIKAIEGYEKTKKVK